MLLQFCVQHYGTHPAGKEVSRKLAAGLNSATIDYHSIRFRVGSTASQERRGGRGVNPKHPWAGANRRNAPKAKMINQRLKDNLGQISEHQYSGRKLSNYSKPAERKGRRAWVFYADEGVRSTTCNQWVHSMQNIQREEETNSMSPRWVDFIYFQSANFDQREQGNANVSHPVFEKKKKYGNGVLNMGERIKHTLLLRSEPVFWRDGIIK